MENLQLFKYCPYITEEIDVKSYFNEYNELLDKVNGYPHNEKIDKEVALRNFFHIPEDIEAGLYSDTIVRNVDKSARTEISEGKESMILECAKSPNSDALPDNRDEMLNIEDSVDPFSVKKMEEDCSIDLLTVENELPPRDVFGEENAVDSGRIFNWYAGAFMDGVIPDVGLKTLQTLGSQAKELYKRETIKNYTRLRHRLLKYSSTVRLPVKKESAPEDLPTITDECSRDVVFNIRVHRPFSKRCIQRKGVCRFPKHSQEMYMLGSQKLTELRDAILCINDAYVHCEMSGDPDKNRCLAMPSSSDLFPSSVIYIGGVFYIDQRHLEAKDYSEPIMHWAAKNPKLGPLTTKRMEETTLSDLKLRLGYPYLYQHLGNCEHLIVFTDVRLHHRMDIQEPSRYPLSRGNVIKLSIFCNACNIHLADWIVKEHAEMPSPITHLCQKCLESFCYDKDGNKIGNFKLYPFFDEFAALKFKSLREEKKNFNVEVTSTGREVTHLFKTNSK